MSWEHDITHGIWTLIYSGDDYNHGNLFESH
jgi:hypothetical protein